MLGLSLSGFDPTETWAAQDFRSAKALFVPSLKRDIVPSIACTRPPAGGVAWQSTSDGENSYSHWAAQQLRGRSRRARSSWRGASDWLPRGRVCVRLRKPTRGFRLGLRDLGYVEGTNIVIEYRWAEGEYEHLRELAAELIRSNVDVIVTHGTPGALPPSKRTRRFPLSWPWWEIRSLRASLPAWRGRVEISPDRAFSPRNSRRREYSFSSS